MNNVLLQLTHKDINIVTIFKSMNVDGMTTIDNTSWIFFHFYVVKAWKQIPLLVQCVEKLMCRAQLIM